MSKKVLVITGHMQADGWQRISDLTLPTKQAYVDKWGGRLINVVGQDKWAELCSEDGIRKWNHFGFARTRACEISMRYHLKHQEFTGIETILYLDADAAFTRYDVNLGEYLDSVSPTSAFYASLDHNGINTGSMAFRVCAASLELLERVWNADPKHDVGSWWEQGCLSTIATKMGIMAHPEKAFFDAYPQEPIRWDCPDFIPGYSFIVHAPAKSDEERLAGLSWCIENGGKV